MDENKVANAPITNDEGCRELLNAIVIDAARSYFSGELDGRPTFVDRKWLNKKIRKRLDEGIEAYRQYIATEKLDLTPRRHRIKCPACGGDAYIAVTTRYLTVDCKMCVANYHEKFKKK